MIQLGAEGVRGLARVAGSAHPRRQDLLIKSRAARETITTHMATSTCSTVFLRVR